MKIFAVMSAVALAAFSPLALANDAPSPQAPNRQAPEAISMTTQEAGPALPDLTVVTYNVGLAHGAVALSAERTAPLIDALTNLDADVLCLQEVWTDDDNQAFIEALSKTYPHSFREVTEDDSKATTPCGICKTLRMKRCADKKCLAEGISVFECVDTGPCKERYDALPDTCKRCLAGNVSNPTSCAMGGAQQLANEGRNGVLLLSKKPMKEPRYIPYDAFLLSRGAIVTEIEGYQVACTHLTADLGMLPYPPEASVSNWAEEHAAEVSVLSEALGEGGCGIIAGDLNTGPGGHGLTAELPESWRLISEAGFNEPLSEPFCTFCQDNILAGSPTDLALDHVLFRGCPDTMSVSYERLFDQPITVEGHGEPTRLSDHYGVKATIRQ